MIKTGKTTIDQETAKQIEAHIQTTLGKDYEVILLDDNQISIAKRKSLIKEEPIVEGVWKFTEINCNCKEKSDKACAKCYVDKHYANDNRVVKQPGLDTIREKIKFNDKGDFKLGETCHNIITNNPASGKGYIDTLKHLLLGTAGVNQTGEASYLAIGTDNTAQQATDVLLGLEKFRKAFSETVEGDNYVLMIAVATTTDGNSAQTTVDDGSFTPTSSEFDVASVAGFNEGDRIRVELDTGYEFVDIDTISTLRITLLSPLSKAPSDGDNVDQAWAEGGIFGDGLATSSVDTGNLFNRVAAGSINIVKLSSKSYILEARFNFVGS